MQLTIVISRSQNGDSYAADFESALSQRCANSFAREVLLTPHLYHIPEDSPIWTHLASLDTHIIFLSWLHPRPVEWLLKRHNTGNKGLTVINMSAYASPDECFAAVQSATETTAINSSDVTPILKTINTDEMLHERWYPVVDRSRCTNCGHCLQFCLFGVYELDVKDQVCVTNPDKCKPGCPACSRVCPHGAIIFPLYKNDETIAGAPGKFMSPDIAARKMFYTRTKLPCPTCGNDGSSQLSEGSICQECGRFVQTQDKSAASPTSDVDNDIDALIDDLDRIIRRSQ